MRSLNFINSLKRKFSFLFLLSLISFGLLFSMISSYLGFMGEDNLVSPIIRRINYILAFIGILISITSGLYRKYLTKNLFLLIILYLYYIFIVRYDLHSQIDNTGVYLDKLYKNSIMNRMIVLVFLPLLGVLLFRIENLNLFLLAKATLISLTASLIMALSVLQISVGTVVDERLEIEGELNSLNLGYWGATLFLLTLYYFSKEKKVTQKNILGAISLIISIYIMMISGSRGPLIYSFIIFYYFMVITSTFSNLKKYLNAILIVGIILIFMDYTFLTDLIAFFNPQLAERITDTILDQDVSGRDELYVIALNQFYSSPLFGDFFVLTSGHYKGEYPHNILLEALMTLGLFGAIPLFYLFFQTLKGAHLMIKNNHDTSWIAFLFLISFFKGMSTWNLYGNTLLWISMGIILSYRTNFFKTK